MISFCCGFGPVGFGPARFDLSHCVGHVITAESVWGHFHTSLANTHTHTCTHKHNTTHKQKHN
jgi:hypothetical protein